MHYKNQNENLSRRNFLKLGTGAVVTGSLIGFNNVQAIGKMMGRKPDKKIPIGLQLYSVREDCAKDFPGTIAKVAKMGYDGVEFAGYYDYPAKDIRKMLDDNGLKCCGTHTGLNTLLEDNFHKTVEFNKILGNKYLIVPSLPKERHDTLQAWKETAVIFSSLAEKAKEYDMLVGYHSHAYDFQPMDGVIPWELFFDNTSKNVVMQIDTANAVSGGGDPVKELKRYPKRAITVHMKEFSATNQNALIGEGDVNWKEVIELCRTIGATEWFIIEEEKNAYPPLESVETCLKNLKKLL